MLQPLATVCHYLRTWCVAAPRIRTKHGMTLFKCEAQHTLRRLHTQLLLPTRSSRTAMTVPPKISSSMLLEHALSAVLDLIHLSAQFGVRRQNIGINIWTYGVQMYVGLCGLSSDNVQSVRV